MAARFLAFALVAFAAQATAQSVSLPLTDDTWINGRSPGSLYGGQSSLFLHNYGPKFVLVKFDPAALGAGANVDSATLRLTLTAAKAPGTIDVLEVAENWDEDSVSWNNQPALRSLAASLTLSSDDIAALAGGSLVLEFDVTTTVADWVDGNLAPEGFMLQTADGLRAFFAAGAAELIVDSGGSGSIAMPGRLDLSSIPVVIDQPGNYFVDQDWDFGLVSGPETVIDVLAPDVTIDMWGFRLRLHEDGSAGSILRVALGASVELRHGSLAIYGDCPTVCFGAEIPAITGNGGVTLKHMSSANINVEGQLTILSSGAGPVIAGSLTAINSRFSCASGEFCLQANFGNIRDNTVFCSWPCEGGISVADESTVMNNELTASDGPFVGIEVNGQNNVIAGNFVTLERLFGDASFQTGLLIKGSENLIKNNFGLGRTEFLEDGNFYGGNRTGPFILNGTTQVDWGGNGPFDP